MWIASGLPTIHAERSDLAHASAFIVTNRKVKEDFGGRLT
jgi:hypothetical protein